MTQLESARKGEITPEMVRAATHDHVSPEELRQQVAAGFVVIPKNRLHAFEARAIGGAIAAANGADFLCYVTPAEHLGLPTAKDVYEGVIASCIAAHIGDIEKGVEGAWQRNESMSRARRRFDWETMFTLAIDPAKARRVRCMTEDKDKDVCTMCGELCAIKTYERFLKVDL